MTARSYYRSIVFFLIAAPLLQGCARAQPSLSLTNTHTPVALLNTSAPSQTPYPPVKPNTETPTQVIPTAIQEKIITSNPATPRWQLTIYSNR